MTQDLDILTCVKNLHLPHIKRKSGTWVEEVAKLLGTLWKNEFIPYIKCLIKSGSYVLNYKRNIFSLFQIFDACVQAEKVLVYYLICYVEVDGLRNKTKYESSRSPEQWFTQFFGFTQKPTTTNITTTGMLKCIKKFAWIVCISNKKILTHELIAFF